MKEKRGGRKEEEKGRKKLKSERGLKRPIVAFLCSPNKYVRL